MDCALYCTSLLQAEPAQTTPELPDWEGGHGEKGPYRGAKGALKGPYW